jgi:hypothetical protein
MGEVCYRVRKGPARTGDPAQYDSPPVAGGAFRQATIRQCMGRSVRLDPPFRLNAPSRQT